MFIVIYFLLLPILFPLSLVLEGLRRLNAYLSEITAAIKFMLTINVNWVCFGYVLRAYILGASLTVFIIQSLQHFFTILKMLQDRFSRNYLIQAIFTSNFSIFTSLPNRVARHNNWSPGVYYYLSLFLVWLRRLNLYLSEIRALKFMFTFNLIWIRSEYRFLMKPTN